MPTANIDIDGGKYLLRFDYRPEVIEAIKTIPSRHWLADIKAHQLGAYDIEATITVLQSIGYDCTFSPLAEKAITQHITNKKNLVILKKQPIDLAVIPTTLKLPLRPFQTIGQNYLMCAKSCLLCDEQGTGKSAQIISTFKALKEQGRATKMMVLCPSSVKGSWAKDIAKFTDLTSVIIEGVPKQRRLLYGQSYDIIIIGYETYLSDFGVTNKSSQNIIPLPSVQILVCDECQRLVRFRNKTTQAILILKEKLRVEYMYLLTGTPIVNKVEDIWSLLCLINPDIVGEFWQFRNRYCVMEYQEIKMLDRAKRKMGIFERIVKKIPKVIGYKNLDELKVKIEPFYIRREKKDVLKDLPDKIYETYEIELTKKQRELYEFLRADFANAFKDIDVTPANALIWFIRAKQTCDSAELVDTENKESAKLDELRDLLEDLMPRDKDRNYLPGAHSVVLFSQYREMTDILVREFEDYSPLYLHGQVKSQDRQILIDAFQNDSDKFKLFISTLRAGGVGITLTAADVVILYDKWFSPSANNQAMDRVHRIGQKNAVTVIDFICKDTLEERVEKILERKKAMFEGIFGEDEGMLAKLTSSELKGLL
jgi:SNF2 family DNA or RNA helicase